MSHDPDVHRAGGEPPSPGFFDRLGAAWDSAGALLATRGSIFRAELGEQAAVLGRGVAALALAVVLALLSFLVLTGLIAALFALLFGSAWAGLLATFVLYLAATGIAATYGVKAFSKLELDFPATRKGLSGDVSAVRAALAPVEDPDGDEDGFPEGREDRYRGEVDVEERFRSGGL